MISYSIIIEEAARLDLIDIVDYISNNFHEPVLAKKMTSEILKEINSLESFPKRAHALTDEPYVSMGYRVTYVKNYAVFYKVLDNQNEVHVMRILYNRREWKALL
ncbi:MAG: type II toxin-antitoxin system RelE/ParE family toxin [Ruminococcus sp.]|nr:type II toxin-antitoxin system RelE/ParE family toxin [Ruminococcus sp.]